MFATNGFAGGVPAKQPIHKHLAMVLAVIFGVVALSIFSKHEVDTKASLLGHELETQDKAGLTFQPSARKLNQGPGSTNIISTNAPSAHLKKRKSSLLTPRQKKTRTNHRWVNKKTNKAHATLVKKQKRASPMARQKKSSRRYAWAEKGVPSQLVEEGSEDEEDEEEKVAAKDNCNSIKNDGDKQECLQWINAKCDAEEDEEDKEKCENIKKILESWWMTYFDKVWLQAGWIVEATVMVLAIILYSHLMGIAAPPLSDQSLQVNGPPSPSIMQFLVGALWGEGLLGIAINMIIICMSMIDFIGYAAFTETDQDKYYMFPDPEVVLINNPKKFNDVFEVWCFIIFSALTILRLVAVGWHPSWRGYGVSAPFRYMIANPYMVLELIALSSTIWGWFSEDGGLNLLWFFLARSFEMLERSGAGLGVRQLKDMFGEDGKLLVTSFVFGLVIWLIMSGCYFVTNRSNEGEQALWESVSYCPPSIPNCKFDQRVFWKKFESIPSSMWFVLINLSKEHPLADAHTTFSQRFFVCVVCILAMPLFGLPVSILQCALFRVTEEEEEEEALQEAAQENRQSSTRKSMKRSTVIIQQEETNYLMGAATALAAYLSVILFIYTTGSSRTPGDDGYEVKVYSRWRFPWMEDGAYTFVEWKDFVLVDFLVAIMFLAEQITRIVYQVRSLPTGKSMLEHVLCDYAFSLLGLIDLVAWLPGMISGIMMFADTNVPLFLSCCVILRTLKLERYIRGFRDMIAIVIDRRTLLAATLLMSLLLWMFFSTLFYATESKNPDGETSEVFASIMRSLWAEIINLHGEWPWADYTSTGKAIGAICAVFSIMLFCVPISIFGDGFQGIIADEDFARPDFDRRPWQACCRPAEPGIPRDLYDRLYGQLHDRKKSIALSTLRAVSTIMVFLSITVTLLESALLAEYENDAKLFDAHNQEVEYRCRFIDEISMAFFFFEFVCQCMALGWRHPVSVVGICDILSLSALTATVWNMEVREKGFSLPTPADKWSGVLMLLRLLRLFSLESYFFAFHTLKNVMVVYWWPLLRAGNALIATWFIFTVSLYYVETHAETNIQNPEDAAVRFGNIQRGLQYGIVHMFGDYPETDYKLEAKVVHFFGIMAGMAIIATFTGVFSASFVEYLRDERREVVRDMIISRLLLATRVAKILQKRFRKRKTLMMEAGVNAVAPRPRPQVHPFVMFGRDVVMNKPGRGANFMFAFNMVLLFNIFVTLISSLPELDRADESGWEITFLIIEGVCTLIFIYDFLVRMAGRPTKHMPMWRVADLVLIFPGIFQIAYYIACGGQSKNPILESISESLAIARVIRVLDFPYFRREVLLIKKAMTEAGDYLGAPGYLSLCVWVFSSGVYAWIENGFANMDDDFEGEAENLKSIPHAMYWCCIFLTGEWANVDFTYWGSRMSIFYVIAGIAFFSLPVGIIVEAVQSTMEFVAQEEADTKCMMCSAKTAKKLSARDVQVSETIRKSIQGKVPDFDGLVEGNPSAEGDQEFPKSWGEKKTESPE